MIRWYDYVLAIVAADWILGMMLWGINATIWWEPIVAGSLAGYIWGTWKNDYCKYRLQKEMYK